MKIIRESRLIESLHYGHAFNAPGTSGGYMFDCDERGVVDVAKLNPEARKNYERCLSGEFVHDAPYVETFRHTYREPAIGLCDCGTEVELGRFTNTCDGCDRDYNSAGQMLAPREQWGEETGEHWSDVARIK